MLKKIAKVVLQQLLKVDWLKSKVGSLKKAQEKRQDNILFAKIMHAGRSVRDLDSINQDTCDILRIVESDGLFVDYLGGNVVGQGYVNPAFIDSVNWGGMKN